MAALFVGLLGLSLLASIGDYSLPRLPAETTQEAVFTSMWQVQAGISALALPVLTFVIERSRDDRHAALHTAEVLGRESWSFLIIGFSFVVLARMGVDLSFFSDEQLVFLSDVLLFLVTVALTLFAYYRVMRITLSPSLLRRRSIDLAVEKTREVLLQSIRVRLGNNLLLTRLRSIGVEYWPFETAEDDEYLVLEAAGVGAVVDVHLDRLQGFIASLPWRIPVAEIGVGPAQTAAAIDPDDRAVWVLFRYGARLSETQRGLIRLKRSSFMALTDQDRQTLEGRLRRVVDVGRE